MQSIRPHACPLNGAAEFSAAALSKQAYKRPLQSNKAGQGPPLTNAAELLSAISAQASISPVLTVSMHSNKIGTSFSTHLRCWVVERSACQGTIL
jgi:hypothetical protein